MKTFTHTLRVRYADTDQMGFVYYGKYAEYFEVARVEALRESGFTYKKMEENGCLLPVIEYNIKYFKPATYDAEIKIVTSAKRLSSVKVSFAHKCYIGEVQINEATVVLACIDSKVKTPKPLPDNIAKVFV